jgi:hypothetical protein
MKLYESGDSELDIELSAPKVNAAKTKKCTKNRIIISIGSVIVLSAIIIIIASVSNKKSKEINLTDG